MDRKTLKELVAEAKGSGMGEEIVWRAYHMDHEWRGEAVYATLEKAKLLTAILYAEYQYDVCAFAAPEDTLPDVTLEWRSTSDDHYELWDNRCPTPIRITAERARPGTP